MTYRLLLLGKPLLVHGSEPIGLRSRKGQALLWYLASHPDTSFSRTHLHGLLWDDMPSDAARRDFNTMLSRLRAELPVDCIQSSRGSLAWNAAAGITTDVAEFLRWTEGFTGNQVPAFAAVTEEQRRNLHRAVLLWRGPFLDGCDFNSAAFEEWVVAERGRWDARMLSVLTALVAIERAEGRWQEIGRLARLALQIDPLQEPFHRWLMEALFQQGNRPAALAQYDACRRLLREELDTEPDELTKQLAERIRTRSAARAVEPSEELHPWALLPAERVGVRRRIVPLHLRPLIAAQPPLVGRFAERRQIADVLRLTASGPHNHVVLLQGEAGIGKTRLLLDVVDQVTRSCLPGAEYGTVLVGRAYESMLDVPYAAVTEALDAAWRAVDPAGLGLSDVWLRELARLLPDVLAQRPDLAAPEPMGSGDDRLRLFQAVGRFLEQLPQPMLLAIDDLQWADSLTLSLLNYLLHSPASRLRLAVIVTVRAGDDSDALQRLLANWQRDGMLTRLELDNLTEDDTVALLQSMFPNGGPGQAARVYARAQGHPLHTVELAAMLAQGETTALDAGAPLPVPPTVQDVFIGRLSRLGPAAADVTEALAMFARGATLDQLVQTAERSEAETAHTVQTLAKAYIVVERRDGVVAFKHDVYRQVVLERLTTTRRTHLHRQAYAAVAASVPASARNVSDPSDVDFAESAPINKQIMVDLIEHARGGQLWEEAVYWSRRAAAAAERLYAFPEAVQHLKTALSCLEQLPASPERNLLRLDIELQITKLDYWSPAGERNARLAAVAELARQAGAFSYVPRIQLAQAESLIWQGQFAEAHTLLRALEPLAERDPRLALLINAWLGAIHTVVGDVRLGLAHLRKVRELVGDRVLKPGTSLSAGIASCNAALGDFEAADAALAEMAREEKAQGYQGLTCKFLTVAATVEYWRGQWQAAAQLARQGVETSQAAEDAYNEAHCALWLGAAQLELGAAESAVRWLETALNASLRVQSYNRRDFIYAFLAYAYELTGQPGKSDEAMAAALRLVERLGLKEGQALCLQMRGRIAAARGLRAEALRHLAEAEDLFMSMSHRSGAGQCRALRSQLGDVLANRPAD